MKYFLLIIVALSILGACKNNKTNNATLDINWQLKQNLVNDNDEAQWLLTLTNTSKTNLPAKGWSIYFNHIQTLKVDKKSRVKILPVNGDLRVLKPIDGFTGITSGQSYEITVFSSGSVLNITDAPLGFYIVFDNDLENGIPCSLTIGEFPKTNLNRTNNEELPIYTPQVAYVKNRNLKLLKKRDFCPIIPTPKKYSQNTGQLIIKDTINIEFDECFSNEAQLLKEKLSAVFTGKILLNQNGSKQIIISKTKIGKNQSEAYYLDITSGRIRIKAATAKGAFYATQSLIALIPIENWESRKNTLVLNNISISDEPRFEYRGMFLDVARNFQPKQNVLRLLDVMAFYKLNKFHFHICDDEGWRVEIEGLSELTSFGAYRGYSINESKYLYPAFGSSSNPVSHGSGYYTTDDFIEILKYANKRHIEVIPEIDMPGHARAAIRSMQVRYNKYIDLNKPKKAEEYLLTDLDDKSEYKSVQGWTDNVVNVGMESTYRFLEKVTYEIVALFNDANAPLSCIHIGGDEVPAGVWRKSPVCNNLIKNSKELDATADLSIYFIKRFSEILSKRGLIAAGWEEIALLHGDGFKPNLELTDKNLRPFVWNNIWNSGAEDIGYKLANAGYNVVLANVTNFYFDLAYNKNPNETGYYWGNFIDTKKPWEYTPLDITKCAEVDRFGHQINRADISNNLQKLTLAGKNNILGIQGLLWSENNLGLERMEYLIFPKLLGLAERAWAQQPNWAKIEDNTKRVAMREMAWQDFTNTIGQFDLPRLDYFNNGVGYRIPTPGAKIEDSFLYVNTVFPGLEIRYTTDGSVPTSNSVLYSEPVKVHGNIKLKTFSYKERTSRMVEITDE